MADKKISALTGATTPLAGTEVLPIVQGGSTVKVSVANLTAGRSIATNDIVASGELTSTTNNARLSLYRSAGTNYFDWASGQTLAFGTQTSQGGGGRVSKVNFLDNGDVTNVTGNFVIGTAGKGIDFSANTHAAGMTSELLNDYEEGTWTPILTDGVNDAVMGSGACQYTKIGRLVTVQGYVYTTSLGSVTGGLNIKGLPFPPLSGGANFTSAAVGFGDSLAITAGQSVGVRITPGSTTAIVALWNSVTGSTVMQASEWTANGEIMFTLSYVVA